MKTTVILRDDLYELLVKEAVKKRGSVRKLSEELNAIIASHFAKKSLFGTTKPFSLSDVRDENDRFD
ncbi:MAG: hypothetical protein ACE5DI_04645 [Candidatus Micrarchaeia archaeon]